MSRTALARRYRPRSFADVATQQHVSETLRRAVASDRVGHAYLFCGPRGVGKTTLARVLAMALNCQTRTEAGEPCGVCESCERIWSGNTSLDVIEIDAASNRGVDDARQLRERAMYAPSEDGRHKIYIVDEAHMLTREAWNTLLKIIEEPPPRVIFIFATTEPQKIEQTASPILSRCQRFDFRRVGMADIALRLREVLTAEGAEATDDALRAIARKADGGMRDALSITDQVLSLAGGAVTRESVAGILGMVPDDRYLELFDLLSGRNHAGIFRFVGELLDEGYDLVEFYHGLMEAMRVVLRLRLAGEEVPELSDDVRSDWETRAERFAPGDLLRMLALGSELEVTGSIRRSAQPRVLLELLLLRMSHLERTVELESLIRALGEDPRASKPPRGGAGSAAAATETGRPPPHRDVSKTRPTRGAEEGSSKTTPSPRAGVARGAEASEAEPESGSAPASRLPEAASAPSVAEAWTALLSDRAHLPEGLGPFLRAGRVEETPEGLLLQLPAGPGLDRLRDASVRKRLEAALGKHLGRSLPLAIEEMGAGAGSAGGRIDQGTVREDRLRDLLEREPTLGAAVEELDLEILD